MISDNHFSEHGTSLNQKSQLLSCFHSGFFDPAETGPSGDLPLQIPVQYGKTKPSLLVKSFLQSLSLQFHCLPIPGDVRVAQLYVLSVFI